MSEERQIIEEAFRGRFREPAPVRQSALATIHRAVEASSGRPVAIKVTRIDPRIPWSRVTPLASRLVLLGEIHHEAIARSLGAKAIEPARCLVHVMEWIDGPTLHEAVLSGALAARTIGAMVEMLRKIAAGLDLIHQSGFLHRDIKPQNIFLAEPGLAPKIADFGVATDLRLAAPHLADPSVGTPSYVAPEQVYSTTLGPASDIYGFAMTIYFVLTQSVAFDAPTARDLLFAQVQETPIPLRRRNESWPVEVERILDCALAKDPACRPRTATLLVEELAAALEPCTPLRLGSFHSGPLSSSDSVRLPRM